MNIRMVFLLPKYIAAVLKLYSKANVYVQRTGNRLASEKIIRQRLATCSECEFFTGKGCRKCSCCTDAIASHFNKLAFPTERCPNEPPSWTEVQDDSRIGP